MIVAASNIRKYMHVEKGPSPSHAYLRLALFNCDDQRNGVSGRMSDAYRRCCSQHRMLE